MDRKTLVRGLGVLGLLAAAFAIWLIVGDWLWRNPEAVSDGETAVVQPSVVPDPQPSPPYRPDPPDE